MAQTRAEILQKMSHLQPSVYFSSSLLSGCIWAIIWLSLPNSGFSGLCCCTIPAPLLVAEQAGQQKTVCLPVRWANWAKCEDSQGQEGQEKDICPGYSWIKPSQRGGKINPHEMPAMDRRTAAATKKTYSSNSRTLTLGTLRKFHWLPELLEHCCSRTCEIIWNVETSISQRGIPNSRRDSTNAAIMRMKPWKIGWLQTCNIKHTKLLNLKTEPSKDKSIVQTSRFQKSSTAAKSKFEPQICHLNLRNQSSLKCNPSGAQWNHNNWNSYSLNLGPWWCRLQS